MLAVETAIILYLSHVLNRYITDSDSAVLPGEIQQLFILLLTTLNDIDLDLNHIVDMSPERRDEIFRNFIYTPSDDEYDPRHRINAFIDKLNSSELLENAKQTILEDIQTGNIYRRSGHTGQYSAADLELYEDLLLKFIEYLYILKHNPDHEKHLYDEEGKRVFRMEGQFAGTRRMRRKHRKRGKTRKHKKTKTHKK
jgi:hypothetical protein